MTFNTNHMPSFLEEFRSMKLELILRDLQHFSTEDLITIQKEIERLLAEKNQR